MKPGHDCDVLIVGAGPVGVTIANLLGTYGICTIVVERSPDILPYPRAVGMDDEALRVFQTAGLAEKLLDDVVQNVAMCMFDRKGRMFANMRPATREFGWWRRNIFMQQLAEEVLREGLDRFEHVQMRLGQEVTALRQDDHGVELDVRDATGVAGTLRAAFCIGCDGGRSTMRELLGVTLQGKTHAIKWLVVDVLNAGVDAPYTSLHCDPRRPHVCIHLPFNYRRWEFMVFAHEDENELSSDASVRQLLAPYVEDPSVLDIVRARIYTHHSRVADRFVVGRAMLAGDAAHLSPPWIGQGLNIGLRDAGNLAWKLAMLVRHGGEIHRVLASYESERRDHAKEMIDLADTFGRLLMPTKRWLAVARDAFFGSVARLPSVRNYVLQMRFKPMPRYSRGLVVLPARMAANCAVGRMLIQPDVEVSPARREKLDTVLGPGFALLGWGVDPQQTLDGRTITAWRALGVRFVRVERSRSGSSRHHRIVHDNGTVCVEDIDNALADWFQTQARTIVMVRPDRYVGAVADAADIEAVSREFLALFSHKPAALKQAA
ncbi:bifunctional 3-(3-hydroxy-phenyl)propionate/3-hydroxycinnamic acid hydroxylase [Variovorax sp. GB1P17]|uniref:bifunctional 3-(3-hydroxy-phenyl)propionate/3-hydroxycinnamic acid hydroxylase n=1 Tax=Variovorax sp. GB1P17 TaxID=3443740 RepID=UPI003F48ED6C